MQSVSISGSAGNPFVRWDGDDKTFFQCGKNKIKSVNEDLGLKKYHLHGQLPPSLFTCCPVLEVLDLSGAVHLEFELPLTLGTCCPRLKQLLLSQCKNLTGIIPPSIGDCGLITDIDMCGCTSLSGDFPESLSALQQLRSLALSGCKGITGSLPQNIFDCKSLAILWVDGCTKLKGKLPSTFNRSMEQICIDKSKVDASGVGKRHSRLIVEGGTKTTLKIVQQS